jgi:glucosamine--fructose-6-phosphate aminotransferase (isomerizing)
VRGLRAVTLVHMCGIVGYVGAKQALQVVVEGLRRLEYRGYDSAGIAVVADGVLDVRKKAGKLTNLESLLGSDPLPGSTIGIGHTRWATHGGPTDANAHPHVSEDGRVAVIHNGIIENFAELRAELTANGVTLRSETDTEVVAHLLSQVLPLVSNDLAEAMRRVCARLDGAFTLVAVVADIPDVVVGARRNSPLVVGRGDGENFMASDVAAFIAHTRHAVELGQDQVVELRRDTITVTDFDGNPAEVNEFEVTWDASAADRGGYDTFMAKEIAEQPKAVADTLRGRIGADGMLKLDEMRISDNDIREVDKVIVIACGTAYHSGMVAKYALEHWTRIPCEVELASEFRYRDPILDRRTLVIACGTAYHSGMVAKYALEHWTRIPCEVELASEFRYRDPILDRRTLVIAISQSGETMDTLMAMRYAREQGARVLAICNTQGSTIPRESDAALYTHAGPEVAVASTKAFLTQIVACYLVALFVAQVRGNKFGDEIASVVRDLADMPRKIDLVLDTAEEVRELAAELQDAPSVLFIGRHVGFPVALEGALKLKELAYMHAEGFAAGELKHGPIALIEEGVPVVVIVPSPRGRSVLHDKIVSNMQEVRARGARTIVIAEEGDESVVPYADHVVRVPQCPTLLQPLLAVVPLQIFACAMATAKGHDVDQPRNLAKSVTVE